MRRLTMLCLLLLTAATAARAQTTMSGPFYNLYGVGAPSGGCSNGYTYTNSSNGDFYSCNAGSWLKVSGGGGGSGTLTASGLSLPVNQIVLANTYPDTKPLGSLGTTTTVLHGNAAGAPSFAGVNLINDAAANQGTTTTLLHGNAAGQPSFAGVNLINDAAANQGTTTTVLHGNAAGQPAFGAVVLSTDVSGQLPIGSVGSAGLSGTAPMAISAAGAISITSPLPVANGGTGTASTLTGLVRGSASAMTAAELSGDATTSASNVVTVTKINGTSVPTNAAADQVLGTTASATAAWATIVNCTDAGGNHLNYTTATHLFSCGTSSSGGLPAHLTYADPTLTVSAATFGNGQIALSGTTSGTATITAPAVAGTSANPITISNVLNLPAGSTSNTVLATTALGANYGPYFTGGGFAISAAGASMGWPAGGTVIANGATLAWGSAVDGSNRDTQINRDSAGVLDFGNGTNNNKSATLQFANAIATGQITDSVATGTAPLVITSTTTVPNLTASNHPMVQFCGTTTSCSHTAEVTDQIVYGSAPLVSGTPSTAAVTGISPAFTSSTSYVCTVSAQSTATTALLSVANVSGSAFTITGPATDTRVVNYICVGH